MAEPIDYASKRGVGWVQMDDGRVNAMQNEWFDAMHRALDQAEQDEIHAVVILGREDVFSAGLDLKLLPRLPMSEIRLVTDRFVETMRRVFLFPKPVIAAATGHAVAGGMMLMLAADIRLAAAQTESRYGLNEATTGVPLAGGTLGICRYGIPTVHHTEFLLHGRLIDAEGCQSRGVFHEVVAREDLLERAEARATDLADVVQDVYAVHKRMLREGAFQQALEDAAAVLDQLPTRNVFAGLDR